MLHLSEIRIGNYFEVQSPYDERIRTGRVTQINQKQVLLNSKWVDLNRLMPISITEDILLHSGFKEFNWIKEASVFECNHFKCIFNENGATLFCDKLTSLKPMKYLHELQNLYFDLTREELETDANYIKSLNAELV